jgi:hypothetical protein
MNDTRVIPRHPVRSPSDARRECNDAVGGTGSGMDKLVMALLVVQLVGGGYLFMSVSSAGSEHSTARASRLPPPLVFGHAMLGLAAPALWIGYLVAGSPWLAWVTLGSLVLSIAGGLVMLSRTAGRSRTISAAAVDPADVRVAEKQIPTSVLVAHGVVAATLLVLVLIEALSA